MTGNTARVDKGNAPMECQPCGHGVQIKRQRDTANEADTEVSDGGAICGRRIMRKTPAEDTVYVAAAAERGMETSGAADNGAVRKQQVEMQMVELSDDGGQADVQGKGGRGLGRVGKGCKNISDESLKTSFLNLPNQPQPSKADIPAAVVKGPERFSTQELHQDGGYPGTRAVLSSCGSYPTTHVSRRARTQTQQLTPF